MAAVSYFIIGPSLILSLFGLARKPKPFEPSSADWRQASIDVVVPAYNAQHDIGLCLASLAKQSIKPRNILLYDDGSLDHTSQYADEISNELGLNVQIIRREECEGKTATVRAGAFESDADIEFVLDSDTILSSEDYIEKLIEALYQDDNIASASGFVLPLTEKRRNQIINDPIVGKALRDQAIIHPELNYQKHTSFFNRIMRGITNTYRDVLYTFLEKVIYRGQQIAANTMINPIGCAVAYRRQHLHDILKRAHMAIGANLTTSEDIYFGFALNDGGFRNIQVPEAIAYTLEPTLTRLYKQIFLWSSAFFQSIYFNFDLYKTPFKFYKRKSKEKDKELNGHEYTKKYGRPIGWYIFFAAFEKVSFPLVIILMIIFQAWTFLGFTLLFETLILATFLLIKCKGKRIAMFAKSFLVTPVRYTVLFCDLIVFTWFLVEISIGHDKQWRK
jgi:glycosyltransferase involved in cell wall biosynthesis